MTRSLKKGPYVDERLMKKIEGKTAQGSAVIKTWVTEDMVGHRLGEFSPTRTFRKHGGKMQKELETKQKESDIAAAQAAKASTTDAKKK